MEDFVSGLFAVAAGVVAGYLVGFALAAWFTRSNRVGGVDG